MMQLTCLPPSHAVLQSEGQDPRSPGYFDSSNKSEEKKGYFERRETYFAETPSASPRELPRDLQLALISASAALRSGIADAEAADVLAAYAEAGEIFSHSAESVRNGEQNKVLADELESLAKRY